MLFSRGFCGWRKLTVGLVVGIARVVGVVEDCKGCGCCGSGDDGGGGEYGGGDDGGGGGDGSGGDAGGGGDSGGGGVDCCNNHGKKYSGSVSNGMGRVSCNDGFR